MLAHVKRYAPGLAAGSAPWLHQMELASANRDFFYAKNDASPRVVARIRSLAYSNSTWRIVLESPNRKPLRVLLDNDLNLIGLSGGEEL